MQNVETITNRDTGNTVLFFYFHWGKISGFTDACFRWCTVNKNIIGVPKMRNNYDAIYFLIAILDYFNFVPDLVFAIAKVIYLNLCVRVFLIGFVHWFMGSFLLYCFQFSYLFATNATPKVVPLLCA